MLNDLAGIAGSIGYRDHGASQLRCAIFAIWSSGCAHVLLRRVGIPGAQSLRAKVAAGYKLGRLSSAAADFLRRLNDLRGPKSWLFMVGGSMLGAGVGTSAGEILFFGRRPDPVSLVFPGFGLLLLTVVCVAQLRRFRRD